MLARTFAEGPLTEAFRKVVDGDMLVAPAITRRPIED
jgi:hypothetical protein